MNMGDATVSTRLIAALEDGDAGVRRNAAWALGNRKELSAVRSLIKLLELPL